MTDIAKRLLDGIGPHIDKCHKLMHEAVNEIKWMLRGQLRILGDILQRLEV